MQYQHAMRVATGTEALSLHKNEVDQITTNCKVTEKYLLVSVIIRFY